MPRRPPRAPQEKSDRSGLPNTSSVVNERIFRSPNGKRYRILRTLERDEYEEPEET